MLGDHRIDSIQPVVIGAQYPRTIGRNARLGVHGSGPTATGVLVRTNAGAEGWGITEAPLDGLDTLVGRPLLELFDPALGVIDATALPLDLALHDLAAKVLEVPVHAMIGDHGREAITCYSGAIYFDDLEPENAPRGLDALLANCAEDWAAGYRAFKLKIGRGHRWMDRDEGFARDVQATRVVREAYPDAQLLVDANDGFDPETTIRYLTAVADCDLFWVEEPFPESETGLRRLRDYLRDSGSRTLIADGELDPNETELLEFAAAGLLDVLLMDIVSYGITAWRHVMPTLAELDVQASPHAWGLPLKTLYASQVAAGLGNVPMVEGVPGSTEGVDTSAYRLEHGVLTVPNIPGFGVPLAGSSHRAPLAQ